MDTVITRLLIVFCLMVFVASVVAARLSDPLGDDATTDESDALDDSAVIAEPIDFGVGVSLNLYHVNSAQAVCDEIDAIVEMGFDSVQVVTPVFQEHGGSPAVVIDQQPGRGPLFDDLVIVLRYAKTRGLRTSLMPQVNLTSPRGNEWRGKIRPDDWQTWWTSYRAVMLDFAELAERADVDLLVIGCELLTTLTEEHKTQWVRLIGECRARFDGGLTYSITWDAFHRVSFWDRLDLIGISGYWDLTRDAKDPGAPSDMELAERWAGIRIQLESFAQARGRSLLITEVGYPSLPWALSDPWNYVPKQGTAVDVEAQARGYRSFVETWRDVFAADSATESGSGDSPWAGVLFYEWGVYTDGGPGDPGFTFRGKPAEDLLRSWLKQRVTSGGE